MKKLTISPDIFIQLGLICAFALGMSIPRGYAIGVIILLLVGIYLYAQSFKTHQAYRLNTHDYAFIGSLVFYGVVTIIIGLIHGESSRYFDQPIRFILCGFIFYAIYQRGLPLLTFLSAMVVACVVMAGISFYQVYILDLGRASQFTNSIQFGNLAMLFAMVCFVGAFFVPSHITQHKLIQILLLLGTGAGIVASILSGSRGGWLLPLLALPISIIWIFRAKATKPLLACTAVLLIGMAFIYNSPNSLPYQRIAAIKSDISGYTPNSPSSNTSVGLRLEMGRLAYQAFTEQPLIGWGQTAYQHRMQQFYAENQTTELAASFNHPHNDYLNDLAKKGILGGVALIIIFAIPFVLFAKRFYATKPLIRAYALMGIVTIIGYASFGLSQSFFAHNNGVIYYLLLLTLLWGGIRYIETQEI